MQGTDQTDRKRRGVGSPEETAFLDLARTTNLLTGSLALMLKADNLSPTLYNVLRILRGTPPGLTCGEIAQRMISRDPDITRLLDSLEKRGLIARWRDAQDRRIVMARITPQGLKLLARLDEPVQELHRKLLGHMGRQRLDQLAELLEEARRHLG